MEETRQRHGCVSVWLWLVILENLVLFFTYFVWIFTNETLGTWYCGVMASGTLVNVLSCILLMRWNKCGLYLFIANTIVLTICNIMVLHLNNTFIVASFIGVIFWVGILQVRKDGVSAWALMRNGWDMVHCRHLYQVFVVTIITVLALAAFTSNDLSSSGDDAVEQTEPSDSEEMSTPTEEETWKSFTSVGGECSVEAPADFHMAELSPNQILGLMCTDYDPALVVVCEPVKESSKIGINSPKEYADVILKQNRNVDGATNYKLISATTEGNYHMVTYDLTVDEYKFRYVLYATKSKKYFYYALVFCLKEYAGKLELKMERMAKSLKPMK